MKTLYVTMVLGCLTGLGLLAQTPQLVWAKSFGNYSSEGNCYAMTTDSKGNVYVTGILFPSYTDRIDFDFGPDSLYLDYKKGYRFVAKYDPDGNVLWAKNLDGQLPGIYRKNHSIAVDDSGNVYTIGNLRGQGDFDPGEDKYYLHANIGMGSESDVFLSKLDAIGNFVWAKLIGGSGYDQGYEVEIDHSGSIYFSGVFSQKMDFDPGVGVSMMVPSFYGKRCANSFVVKLDSKGNFLWANQILANFIPTSERGCSFTVDEQSNVYIAADVISKFTSNGTKVWEKELDGNPDSNYHAVDLGVNRENMIYIYSDSYDQNKGGSFSILDSNGSTISARSSYQPGNGSKTQDRYGNIYSLHNPSSYSLTDLSKSSRFNHETWRISLTGSTSGNNISGEWYKAPYNYGYSVSLDGEGNIYVLGKFTGTLDADPSDGVYMLDAPLGSLYLLKLRDVPLDVEEHITPITFSVYPNPGTTTITAAFGKDVRNATVRITDLLGQVLVSHVDVNGNSLQVDVSQFSQGMYVLELSDGGIVSRVKVVKE